MKICQLEEAEPALDEDGLLYYVVNVPETKNKSCSVVLSQRRKEQIEKFICQIRPALIGSDDNGYIFGQKSGEKMVSKFFHYVQFNQMVKFLLVTDYYFRVLTSFPSCGEDIGLTQVEIQELLKINFEALHHQMLHCILIEMMLLPL